MGTVGTRNRARNRTRHVANSSLPYCFQHDACTAMLHAQPMHGLANSVSSPCSWQMMHIVGASAYTALRGARTYTCLVNGSYPAKNSIFGMIYPRTHACTKSAASRLAATTMDVQYTASSAPNVWYDRITPPRAGITPKRRVFTIATICSYMESRRSTISCSRLLENLARHTMHSSRPHCFQHDACTAMLHAQPMHGLANSPPPPRSRQMVHASGTSACTALRGARTYTCLVNGSYPE